jgi:hypothetical protein
MHRTAQSRQTIHALTALAYTTPGRRHAIQTAAENYLSQVERRHLPVGYKLPILNDRINRADAYRMRCGDTFARMLGIACRPSDEYLPDTARAVLDAINAPVDQLTELATASGQPMTVAVLWLATAGHDRLAIAPGTPLPKDRTTLAA